MVPRTRTFVFGFLASAALAGCGGGGGLFATVPPPVEFIGSLAPGLEEVPKAGTYAGTVMIERINYVYTPGANGEAGRWSAVSADPIEGPVPAQAIVDAKGAVRLRKTDGVRDLFVGTLQVEAKPTVYGSTTASLIAFDGTKGIYPYLLQDATPLKLDLLPRANVRRISSTRLVYDRYSFSFDLN